MGVEDRARRPGPDAAPHEQPLHAGVDDLVPREAVAAAEGVDGPGPVVGGGGPRGRSPAPHLRSEVNHFE